MRVPASVRAFCRLRNSFVDKDVAVHPCNPLLRFCQRCGARTRADAMRAASGTCAGAIVEVHLFDGGGEMVLLVFDPPVCSTGTASPDVGIAGHHGGKEIFVVRRWGRAEFADSDGGGGCRGLYGRICTAVSVEWRKEGCLRGGVVGKRRTCQNRAGMHRVKASWWA